MAGRSHLGPRRSAAHRRNIRLIQLALPTPVLDRDGNAPTCTQRPWLGLHRDNRQGPGRSLRRRTGGLGPKERANGVYGVYRS